MKTANEILDMVNEFLEHLPYDRKPSSLYEPIQYVLSMGGKRIRPTLMLMAYNLYQENPEKILMNAIALETYHNYTLLHDDLMDNADMRRGKLTVHKKWDANNLYKFGEQIGLAFQLQDDFLDVYGDPKVFGKEIGGDITSNKKTYMLINAFNHANAQQREELNRWVSAKDFVRKEKVEAVTRLYDEIGIDKMAQEKIAYYFEQSKKYLDAVQVPVERKEELQKYAQKMMKRKY